MIASLFGAFAKQFLKGRSTMPVPASRGESAKGEDGSAKGKEASAKEASAKGKDASAKGKGKASAKGKGKSAEAGPVFKRMVGWENNSVVLGDGLKMIGENALAFRFKSKGNRVVIGKGVTLRNVRLIFNGTGSELVIEDDAQVSGHIQLIGEGRRVVIGARTTIVGATILARGADVSIGADCMFSREIEIRATDVHKLRDADSDELLNPARDVVIEDGVWLAARAFVSKGAHIAKGSVVGACSFVNKRFEEPRVVLAGVPARIVRRNVVWER